MDPWDRAVVGMARSGGTNLSSTAGNKRPWNGVMEKYIQASREEGCTNGGRRRRTCRHAPPMVEAGRKEMSSFPQHCSQLGWMKHA